PPPTARRRASLHAMRLDHSRAPPAFANDIEGYLGYLGLERGLSKNALSAYRSDLDQCAAFLAQRRVGDWRRVSAAQAGEWLHSLNGRVCSPASLARKLTALRGLARYFVREKLRDDDFTALLAAPKLTRRIPGTLTTD